MTSSRNIWNKEVTSLSYLIKFQVLLNGGSEGRRGRVLRNAEISVRKEMERGAIRGRWEHAMVEVKGILRKERGRETHRDRGERKKGDE